MLACFSPGLPLLTEAAKKLLPPQVNGPAVGTPLVTVLAGPVTGAY